MGQYGFAPLFVAEDGRRPVPTMSLFVEAFTQAAAEYANQPDNWEGFTAKVQSRLNGLMVKVSRQGGVFLSNGRYVQQVGQDLQLFPPEEPVSPRCFVRERGGHRVGEGRPLLGSRSPPGGSQSGDAADPNEGETRMPSPTAKPSGFLRVIPCCEHSWG